ncbi:hypothetical protein MGYG_05512 [Nannizzia gypsea CBS 118893]|uniref:Uncharacterized protein n=1 Tax=Arthroderma gypseum (strain ATCC MYA-4604 / CBS 118893) TaxID=535722 RepID=E4UWC2_ARTGP|nr:hypothetical protein MGYG_05512 [Nannizzia gypsea CBS 118893]EFR02517.1 hypothetical protein MGYG_05512 [Nannizzia gypsea CBS 118893]
MTTPRKHRDRLPIPLPLARHGSGEEPCQGCMLQGATRTKPVPRADNGQTGLPKTSPPSRELVWRASRDLAENGEPRRRADPCLPIPDAVNVSSSCADAGQRLGRPEAFAREPSTSQAARAKT